MFKLNTPLNRVLLSSLAVLAFASLTQSAAAQEQFPVKITKKQGVSAEVNYKSMERQATIHCKRETRRIKNRIIPMSDKFAYVDNCVFEVMENVMKKIDDPDLIAMHNFKHSGRIRLTQRDTTIKE